MAIVFALLAAAANAVATIFQRIGIEDTNVSGQSSCRLMAAVIRRPIWFLGLLLTTTSFLLQAIALSLGNLSKVQPVMVTEILFLVVILGIWFNGPLGWREWVGATGTAAGLGAFLVVSSSSGGTARPSRSDWILLLAASIGAMFLSTLGARRGGRSWRAACFGVAAAISFALTAAFIKTVADQWSNGPTYVFTHFEAYGVAVAGLTGLVLSQHALDAGPVAASQSAMLIVNPLASIVMGIWLFDDQFRTSLPREVFDALSLAVMFIALYILSHSPLIATSEHHERLSAERPIGELHSTELRG